MFAVCLTIVFSYGFLILWFAFNLHSYPTNSSGGDGSTLPKVSVIVAARNEEKSIETLIALLADQSYPTEAYEIIIADDRSSDETGHILERLSAELSNLSYVKITETPGGWAPKKWALHNAVLASTGELILQTDADCRPGRHWVSALAAGFSDPRIGFISAPAPLRAKPGFTDDLYEMESLAQDALSAGGLASGVVLSCTGRNLAFRRRVFDEVSGYAGISHFISGDDDLLLHKLAAYDDEGIQFCAAPAAVVESDPPATVAQLIRQRLRFASKGLDYYQLQTSRALRTILPLIFLANLSIVITLIIFTETARGIWLLPLLVKAVSDAVLIRTFFHKIDRHWSLLAFIVLALAHPFYVIIFGSLGPFVQLRWKES